MDDHVIDYKSKANGRFSGILRWPQFETLWVALSSSPQEWYVYAPNEGAPPAKPFSADEMKDFLSTTETYLRERCTSDFCGAVYADNVNDPDFVKIYNPRLMGGCGMGKAALPQWLISHIAPVSLLD
ncbi:MAG: hypothetical protein GY927_04015 [bacterium]|nr:hypothetical protein [bacterium]